MKNIASTASEFGISQCGVWKLIRTHGIRTEVVYRFGQSEILVDTRQVRRYFEEHPDVLVGLRTKPK